MAADYRTPDRLLPAAAEEPAAPPGAPPKPVLSAPAATHDGLRFWQYMLAGSVAGVVEHTAMFPVDTLKTHMQAGAPPCRPALSLGAALRNAVAGEGGALALYRGLPAMALGAGPAHAVYFSVYELAKSALTDRLGPNNPAAHAASGVLATIASDAVFTPMDTVKQRLQLTSSPYTGVGHCIRTVLRDEGPGAFFVSYRTTIVMNAPYTAVHFATYEAAKRMLGDLAADEESLAVHATAGAAAGALAAAVTTPLDVVKTQLQCQGVCGCERFSSSSIADVFRTIIKRDGYSGLMRGWKPRMLFHTPAAAICWSTYEASKSFFARNEVVAVKCLDLDQLNNNIDEIQREAQIMSLIDHPNVIRAYCSFVVEHSLWVIMPFMTEGSCLHLMKISYQDGFDEPVIGSILKETLKALEYLHRQGQIHRDVKAGNILIDGGGVVKLGDFGVSACMFDRGDRQRSRNTFVGTPCWMAPEVLQPGTGYNFKADIWSFGITALELAHGHAPFSKYPPMKVLLMTLQNAPPGLDYERDKRFSKSFKEMVAMCLVKDQTKRPTAEKLLKHSFFKNAKPPELTIKSILSDLPPLWDRVKALQLKDAAQLALKKMPSSEQEALSLSEYQRGVSAWNFDIEDLKAQASLIHDDEPPEIKEDEDTSRSIEVEKDSSSRNHFGKSSSNDCDPRGRTFATTVNSRGNSPITNEAFDFDFDFGDTDPKKRADGCENNSRENDSLPSTSKREPESNHWTSDVGQRQQTSGGNNSSMAAEKGNGFERDVALQMISDKQRSDMRKTASLSGPLSLPTRASANSLSAPIRSSGVYVDSSVDKSKRNVVEIKGRFSVTSENVDLAKVQEVPVPVSGLSRKSPEGSLLRKSASASDCLVNAKLMCNPSQLKELCNSSVSSSILIPHLNNLVQQTMFQQDLIMNLLSSLQQNEKVDGSEPGISSQVRTMESDKGQAETANSEKERSLLVKISELQSRMITLTDELIAAKLKHAQLQQELNALYCREEIEDVRDEDNEET